MTGVKLDVIGIGALNFDFMFEIELESRSEQEGGTEFLDSDAETRVKEKFSKVQEHPLYTKSCKFQYGGAAFGAMRAAHGVSILEKHKKSLRIGYVGVYGEMHSPFSDMLSDCSNVNGAIKQSMEFLDPDEGKTFLFHDKGQNGVGYFPVSSVDGKRFKRRKGDLLTSEISQGVNKTLQQRIEEKEIELGKGSFSRYLSSAEWIHISSLVEVEQFMWLIGRIKEAKENNAELIVSMDPGSTYMSENVEEMKLAYKVCDFIFLSGYEVTYFDDIFKSINLLPGSSKVLDFNIKEYIGDGLHCTFIAPDSEDRVHKYKALKIKDNTANVEIIQRKVYEVVNDTGSGSAFAGGFILANVNLGLGLEAAISLGNLAEGLRLVSDEYPYETVDLKTGKPTALEKVLSDTREILDIKTMRGIGMPFHIRFFLARPFNGKYDVFERAVRSVLEDAPFFFEVRTALDYVHRPGLFDNIKEHITTSHGVIAEVSELNANVMLEVGATLAGSDDRPLFIVRDKNYSNKVAVDFAHKLRIEYDSPSYNSPSSESFEIDYELVRKAIMKKFFEDSNKEGRIIDKLLVSLVNDRKKKKASFLSKNLLQNVAIMEKIDWLKDEDIIAKLTSKHTLIEELLKDSELNDITNSNKKTERLKQALVDLIEK